VRLRDIKGRALKKENSQKKLFPYEFQIDIETRAQGHVVARCAALPGCQAQGRNSKEALDNLKNAIDLYFTSSSPAYLETLEQFNGVPIFYSLAEFKGRLFAATGRDKVFVSNSGAPGSWSPQTVTKADTKFFTPDPGQSESGDYSTQIYCLTAYGTPGAEKVLFAGTNLNGSVYYSADGENWKESFATGEDRIHTLCEFKNRLYAGTSSQGKIYAYDGLHWNAVANLSEAAVTALGVFKNKLYVGTYPSGLIFRTDDGLNWEEMASTEQSFVQCLKEFNGALYAGTSGSKGVKIFRTTNGRDWITVYDSGRELNCYCMEVFENTLFAGTGNSGRVLKTRDGMEWATAYAGDMEGVRAFAVFNDYLYAGSENPGLLLRSTYDMARDPVISELKVQRVTSQSVMLSWLTDIAATSEVHYGEKNGDGELTQMFRDKAQTLKHKVFLTGLRADTDYELRVISAHRSSSRAVSENLSVKTPPVVPPTVTSPSHPQQDKWEKTDTIEIVLSPAAHLSGYYYTLDNEPGTVPVPPEASYTDSSHIILPGVPQGQCYVHVSGVDGAGNIGVEAAHYRVNIDTEALPPVKVFSSTHPDPDKWVPNPTPVIAWEAPGDLSGVVGYYVKADKVPDTVPGPSKGDLIKETRITLGPLEDDLWYVHISTLDAVGNVGVTAAHYPLRIDTKAQAPAIESPSHPENETWYSNHKLEINLIPAQDLSGVDGHYYLLNQEPHSLPTPEDARWTKKNKVTFDRLEDGIWYFHARTKDRAENVSHQATHFKACIDTEAVAPIITSHTHPDEKSWYRDRYVVLNWEAPEELSGVDGYFYSIDRKAGTVPDDKSALFTAQRTLSFELTEDGLWYFHVTTKDKAGNLSRQAGHYALRVDTMVSKPSVVSSTHPEEAEWYSRTKVVFHFTAPEDLSGVAGFYYTFSDDPRVAPAAQGSSYTEKNEVTLEIPRDGVHYLSVICADKAGNISAEPTVYKVKLDTHVEAPELSSPTHPEPLSWYGGHRVEIVWKDPADLSGVEGYYTAINREENWMPILKDMAWTTAKSAVFNLPEDGVWYAHICAKDRAQNIGAMAHYKVMVDSHAVAPIVKSLTHPIHRWVGNPSPKLTWEVPQDMAGIEGYYVVLDHHPHTIPGVSNGEWVNRTFMTVPTLKDGKWFFHIAAKDKAGNVSKEATHYPIWVDTTPPTSTMVQLPALMDKTQLSINWDATDASGEVVCFDVQVKAGTGAWTDWLVGVTNKQAVYQGQDGMRYAFRCRAKDSAGNLESYPETEMISLAIDISPPTPVTHLKATPVAGGDIELKWSPAEDKVSGLKFYRVYRWVEGKTPKAISTDGEVKEVSFTDRGAELQENTVYYYAVHPVDNMGNEQFEGNATATSLSDASVGTPAVSSPSHSSDDWSSNPIPVVTWTAPADTTGIEGYYYAIDLSPSTKLTSESGTFVNKTRLELPRQESGIWYFHLIAKDRAGNTSEQTAHYRFKIDVQKPEAPHVVSISHPDKERWYSEAKVEFQLTFAAKLSGLDCYYFVFDQKPDTLPVPDSASKSVVTPVEVKAAGPGMWYFHVTARDKAGNLSKPVHTSVLISAGEMPPPVIASPTHPREEEAVNNQSPVFTWDDRHDGTFETKGYFYRLSPNETDTLTDVDSYTTEKMITLKDVAQGTWYLHVAAVAKKGKPGALYSTRKIVIDRLGKVFGHFLRKDGKTPVVGTKVEMLQGDKAVVSCVTDAAGKFNFPTLHEGKYEIRLHSDQFPVLRIKDINVTMDEGLVDATFIEDLGILPNPPKPGPVRFYYFLKEDCNVTFELFDATGALVQKLEDKKEGGAYNVTIWDSTKMPVGEYLYKLSAKSVLKNTMSRFSVKKFRLEKPVVELEPQTVS
jgi:predicted RNase H-like HicB family nuclease